MSVDVQAEVLIERSREAVAGIMFNPKCDKLWIGGLSNVFPLTPGNLKKGAKVERIGDFLNRRFSSMLLVLRDEPEKMVELSANEPFEMKIRYELLDVPGGTIAKIRIQSIGEMLFQMPATLISRAVSDNINRDLKKLKKHLEENTN